MRWAPAGVTIALVRMAVAERYQRTARLPDIAVLEVGVEAIAAGAGPAQEEEGGGDEPEAAL